MRTKVNFLRLQIIKMQRKITKNQSINSTILSLIYIQLLFSKKINK